MNSLPWFAVHVVCVCVREFRRAVVIGETCCSFTWLNVCSTVIVRMLWRAAVNGRVERFTVLRRDFIHQKKILPPTDSRNHKKIV
jgi:hypothetical protein